MVVAARHHSSPCAVTKYKTYTVHQWIGYLCSARMQHQSSMCRQRTKNFDFSQWTEKWSAVDLRCSRSFFSDIEVVRLLWLKHLVILSGVGATSRAVGFVRKVVKTKTWEDEVSVDVKPFVDYFRNIQRNPEEYLDVRFITLAYSSLFFHWTWNEAVGVLSWVCKARLMVPYHIN